MRERMLSAGDMDRRITIQKATEAQDATGADVQTWADVLTTWAKFEPIDGGREPFVAPGQQFAAFADSRFTIRYRTDVAISPKNYRVVHDGKTYDITGVRETRRRETLEIVGYARAE
jgi:SPP1 family predicted phage head-tail adaptor